MSDDPFKTRTISGIKLSNLGLYPTSQEPMGGCTLTFEMTTASGETGGPQVQLNVGVDIRDETTLRDFRFPY
jgi:hypothetical protein